MRAISSVVSHKCPSCGAEIKFEPSVEKMQCDYCLNTFTVQQLEDYAEQMAKKAPEELKRAEEQAKLYGYSCPSCGAEVITDTTTAATTCFYCHNPVSISARLAGEFKPDSIIPFALNREAALEKFQQWIRTKKYVPRDFFSAEQLEKMVGVYFPYWVVDAQLRGKVDATSRSIRTWQQGSMRYTETKTFKLEREGDLYLSDLIKKALKKANRQLVESVQPFDNAGLRDFSYTYLAGFQAEKRDIEAEELDEVTRGEFVGYATEMMRSTVANHPGVSNERPQLWWTDLKWRYCLLPVWVLTYRQEDDEKVYYYAMNGQTGKVNGELPVDKRRLRRKAFLFGLITFAVTALLVIGVRYLL